MNDENIYQQDYERLKHAASDGTEKTKISTDNFVVSVDIGYDSTKAVYSYYDGEKVIYDAIRPDFADFPSVAYFDERKKTWHFGQEICDAEEKDFKNLVRVKDLLELFITEREYYSERSRFPVFYYPPVDLETYSYDDLVKNGHTFDGILTPREVCKNYLGSFLRQIFVDLSEKLGDIFRKRKKEFVLIFPGNSSIEVVKELRSLLYSALGKEQDSAFGKTKPQAEDDIFVLSAPKGVAFAALETKIAEPEEKNVLLFDIGAKTTSVVGLDFQENNIVVDAADAHQLPLRKGGEDFTRILYELAQEKSNAVPAIGMDGLVEKMTYFGQYDFYQSVKESKVDFSKGVDLPMAVMYLPRETKLTIKIERSAFVDRSKDVVDDICEYIKREVGNKTVTKIILSGGASATCGLCDGIQKKFKKIKIVDFLPEAVHVSKAEEAASDPLRKIDFSTYAAAVGGALFGMKKYKLTLITSVSFGTFNVNPNTNKYWYVPLVPQGKTICFDGKHIPDTIFQKENYANMVFHECYKTLGENPLGEYVHPNYYYIVQFSREDAEQKESTLEYFQISGLGCEKILPKDRIKITPNSVFPTEELACSFGSKKVRLFDTIPNIDTDELVFYGYGDTTRYASTDGTVTFKKAIKTFEFGSTTQEKYKIREGLMFDYDGKGFPIMVLTEKDGDTYFPHSVTMEENGEQKNFFEVIHGEKDYLYLRYDPFSVSLY